VQSSRANASAADDRKTTVSRDSELDRHPSARCLRGLDWLNFLLADVQSGVGPFLAIYFATFGWNEQRVGLALTIGGIAGIASQTPAGALVDRLESKRALIAAGVAALAIGALSIAFYPSFGPVVTAQALIGAMSSFLHARDRRHLTWNRWPQTIQPPPGAKPDIQLGRQRRRRRSDGADRIFHFEPRRLFLRRDSRGPDNPVAIAHSARRNRLRTGQGSKERRG